MARAAPPSPRMGWRSFLPLAVAGLVVILLIRPGGETLNLVAWSEDLVDLGGGEPFPAHLLANEVEAGDLAELAGIRWVDIRIALRGGRADQADSIGRILAASLDERASDGRLQGLVEGLIGRELPPSVREIEEAQEALVEDLGPMFVEAAVLETLRRAAGIGAGQLAVTLVDHPSLDDGEGEDLADDVHAGLEELCRNDLTPAELREMEAIVTGVLRQRTS